MKRRFRIFLRSTVICIVVILPYRLLGYELHAPTMIMAMILACLNDVFNEAKG